MLLSRLRPARRWPDANNTGVTGNLTLWGGSRTFSTAGQTVQDTLFETALGIAVTADNVTFNNCKFVYTGALDAVTTGLINNVGANTTFTNCELDGNLNTYPGLNSVSNTKVGLTVTGCNFHGMGHGIRMGTGPAMIRDNYFWNIDVPAAASWHTDGIFAQGTSTSDVSNISVIHNTFLLPGAVNQTGAILVRGSDNAFPSQNILIENNLCAGGSYAIHSYPAPAGSGTTGNNYRILNNKFSTRYWPGVGVSGLWYPSGDYTDVLRKGNVIFETGAPVDS